MSNRKNILIGSLFAASLALAPTYSFAQINANVNTNVRAQVGVSANATATASTTVEQKQKNREDKFDQIRLNIEARIENHAEWMVNRFEAAVERLEKLTSRIESRIAKIKAEGKNTTEAEKFVADAKIEIGQAKAGIANIDATLEAALEADTLRGAFTQLRTLANSIREDLKAAHRALMSTIPIIKGLSLSGGANASTSVQTVQ